MVRNQFRSDPAVRREKTLSWDYKGIDAKSENGQMLLPWSDFTNWRENDSTILIYRSRLLGLVIPKRAFETPQQMWEFQGLMSSKIKNER